MWITYRRTGSGLGAIAAVLAVTVFTVAVAAFAVISAVIGAVVLAPVAILARAMRPESYRSPRASSTSFWPQETIEAEVVRTSRSSDERDLQRLDTDKG